MERWAKLEPGVRVKVVQTIQRREGPWETSVEGEVVEHEAARTGSWFAHAAKGQLWLNRLTVRKDDGELVRLALDGMSRVTVCQPQGEAN